MSNQIKGLAVCEVCGNDYDKAFEVTMAGNRQSATVGLQEYVRD